MMIIKIKSVCAKVLSKISQIQKKVVVYRIWLEMLADSLICPQPFVRSCRGIRCS